ncbi:MAG: hypothetical protein JW934_24490 [Anaerolineae bacterium]|nr:hypothetical protein [Anaerolineae bacterium]
MSIRSARQSSLLERRFYVWVVAGSVAVAVLYLGWLGLEGNLGFPLDDAWIHQTYARNLVRYGEFAYMPGQVSAGSTAPLWTLLLAPAHLIRIDPQIWSCVLGLVMLGMLAVGVRRVCSRLFSGQPVLGAAAGLIALLEWHLAWAAFSGMETLLYACGVVWLIERYLVWEAGQREPQTLNARPRLLRSGTPLSESPFMLGLLGGLLVLVRPEGLLLVALLAVAGLLARRRRSLRRTLSIAADALAGFALLLLPYLSFNLLSSGLLFPNTLYAKQAEYAELLGQPVWVRLWRVLKPTLTGAQVLLVPGAVYAAAALVKPRRNLNVNGELGVFTRLVPVLWWGMTVLLYALRLPVDYQHGRYLMPTIPVLILLGTAGTLSWLCPRDPRLIVRVSSRALPWILALLLLGFLVLGAHAFATDLAIINGEMVQIALWLNENTPPDALIAAHDIGAIGYFAQRPLLDLAGLVTPEIIPFIRDQRRLLEFIIEQKADYVVTFPSWYGQIAADERLVLRYQADCELTRAQGGDDMAVYQVQ